MQIKGDFVTNSSSASFIIPLKELSERQIHMIHNHVKIAKKLPFRFSWVDEWEITETKEYIEGYTLMDNFNMLKYLTVVVGVDREVIKYDCQN